MPIKTVDLKQMADRELEKRFGICRKVLMNGPRFHSWLHVYPTPGDHDEMHCHNADQTFCGVEGECTIYFENGDSEVLKPGMAAFVTGGSFYWLENTGEGRMVLLGTRAISYEMSKKIDYRTRKDLHPTHLGDPPKSTSIFI